MIASVHGTVLALRLDAAVVEVGGVGLLLHATPATLAGLRVGDRVALHVPAAAVTVRAVPAGGEAPERPEPVEPPAARVR